MQISENAHRLPEALQGNAVNIGGLTGKDKAAQIFPAVFADRPHGGFVVPHDGKLQRIHADVPCVCADLSEHLTCIAAAAHIRTDTVAAVTEVQQKPVQRMTQVNDSDEIVDFVKCQKCVGYDPVRADRFRGGVGRDIEQP